MITKLHKLEADLKRLAKALATLKSASTLPHVSLYLEEQIEQIEELIHEESMATELN